MNDAPQLPDFREPLAQAQRWTADLIAGTGLEQLGLPTACPEFDVRELIAHVYKGTLRVQGMGRGRAADSIDFTVDELPSDLAEGYRERARDAMAAWADEAQLARPVVAPWGPVPGAMALGGYLTETLAHAWDLAEATSQPSEIDPQLASMALAVAQRAIPAVGRAEMPFGEVVPSQPDAGPTALFVHWMGRGAASPTG